MLLYRNLKATLKAYVSIWHLCFNYVLLFKTMPKKSLVIADRPVMSLKWVHKRTIISFNLSSRGSLFKLITFGVMSSNGDEVITKVTEEASAVREHLVRIYNM